MAVIPRLQEVYEQQLVPQLTSQLARSNRLALPRLVKIVVSMGVGSAISEKKHLDQAADALSEITGQRPAVTRATKSVAGFRLREGVPIGCKVTLRGARMYEFLDRLTDQPGAAPGPRLPRLEPAGLRRPRQLQPGALGTAGLSRDQPGQIPPRAGDERDDRDQHQQ